MIEMIVLSVLGTAVYRGLRKKGYIPDEWSIGRILRGNIPDVKETGIVKSLKKAGEISPPEQAKRYIGEIEKNVTKNRDQVSNLRAQARIRMDEVREQQDSILDSRQILDEATLKRKKLEARIAEETNEDLRAEFQAELQKCLDIEDLTSIQIIGLEDTVVRLQENAETLLQNADKLAGMTKAMEFNLIGARSEAAQIDVDHRIAEANQLFNDSTSTIQIGSGHNPRVKLKELGKKTRFGLYKTQEDARQGITPGILMGASRRSARQQAIIADAEAKALGPGPDEKKQKKTKPKKQTA